MTDVTPPSSAAAAEKLKMFIATRYLPAGSRLTDDAPLLTSGIIDSFGLVDLSHFLEDTFDVTVPDVDLTPDRMNTVRMIVAHLEWLRAR
jgi:acyl carrier protein